LPIVEHLLPPHMQRVKGADPECLRAYVKQITEEPQLVHESAARRMARMDALPREVRLLIHEYGKKAQALYTGGVPPHKIEARILADRRDRDIACLDLDL